MTVLAFPGASPPVADIVGRRRPDLLVRAGAIGADLYSRPRHLRRIIRDGQVETRKGSHPAPIVRVLKRIEAKCDRERREGAPGYTAARHVLVLSALIAESRRLASAAGGR